MGKHLSNENMGLAREAFVNDPNVASKPKLPDSCIIIPSIEHELISPMGNGPVTTSHDLIPDSTDQDTTWVRHITGPLLKIHREI